MSKLEITIDESKLREIIAKYLRDRLGDTDIDVQQIKIQVKSDQNYKSVWETAEFRATYTGDI